MAGLVLLGDHGHGIERKVNMVTGTVPIVHCKTGHSHDVIMVTENNSCGSNMAPAMAIVLLTNEGACLTNVSDILTLSVLLRHAACGCLSVSA